MALTKLVLAVTVVVIVIVIAGVSYLVLGRSGLGDQGFQENQGSQENEIPLYTGAIENWSFTDPSTGVSLRLFTSTDVPDVILSFYSVEMPKRGWIFNNENTENMGIYGEIILVHNLIFKKVDNMALISAGRSVTGITFLIIGVQPASALNGGLDGGAIT